MAGIVERLGSMAGTEAGKAVNLAHETFQSRMGAHNHTGRALLETFAAVARQHPNLMGIGAGLLVEQILVAEREHHQAAVAAGKTGEHDLPRMGLPHVSVPHVDLPHVDLPHVDLPHLHAPHLPTSALRLGNLRPGHIALEVFGALLLLKLARSGARLFRRKNQPEIWFAPAAKIHLLSGTLAAYYLARSLKSPRVSAWRNAAVALFATDAIKPVLKAAKPPKGGARRTAAIVSAAGPTLSAPPPAAPIPPAPPQAGPPVSPAPTPVTPEPETRPTSEAPVPSDKSANDRVDVAPAAAATASPNFWTPPPAPSREGPRGEIIQWTGFTGGDAASSRLID